MRSKKHIHDLHEYKKRVQAWKTFERLRMREKAGKIIIHRCADPECLLNGKREW